jgi:hypothetical protein
MVFNEVTNPRYDRLRRMIGAFAISARTPCSAERTLLVVRAWTGDQGSGIVWYRIPAPSHVLVGPRQDELPRIERTKPLISGNHIQYGQRNVARGRGVCQRSHFNARVETQQRVPGTHSVVERTSIAKPNVRCPATRHGGGRELGKRVPRLRFSIVRDNR